jgi:parvulin-like peptidyl-prolyl isomerase
VIDALVENLLLAQGAAEGGFSVDEAALQAEIDRLAGQLGSTAALTEWQARNGYTEATFRSALRRSMAAAWQRDRIAETIPAEAEQVHARQILTLDEASAQNALQRVRVAGANFATVAFIYDSQIGGDLGWFPRGYLTQPQVESAAFALQPGEISEIIPSQVGYHILQIIAREVRPLSPDARRALQRAAISSWLAQRRGASAIEIIN